MSIKEKLLISLRQMKAEEADGWEYFFSHKSRPNRCCPGDDWADGYNEAIKDVIKRVRSV